jgi:hypothetical protein
MDESNFKEKLFAAAKHLPERDEVPFGFEHRVMNRLQRHSKEDKWVLWSHALWRAVGPCLAVMSFMYLWTAMIGDIPARREKENLAVVDLESALLAPMNDVEESW